MPERRKRRRKFLDRFGECAIVSVIVAIIFVAIFALSWGVTIGIIKLITMCFNWKFSLLGATGVWLIIILFRGIFQQNKD